MVRQSSMTQPLTLTLKSRRPEELPRSILSPSPAEGPSVRVWQTLRRIAPDIARPRPAPKPLGPLARVRLMFLALEFPMANAGNGKALLMANVAPKATRAQGNRPASLPALDCREKRSLGIERSQPGWEIGVVGVGALPAAAPLVEPGGVGGVGGGVGEAVRGVVSVVGGVDGGVDGGVRGGGGGVGGVGGASGDGQA